jgi:formylglycine-generating enzyme required for sulfatase activity
VGNPKSFKRDRFWNRIFGADTEPIGSYIVFDGNSNGKTAEPSAVDANPLGLLNMAGNVREFCLDWYAPDAYSRYAAGASVVDPAGPPTGEERVVRGGSFKSSAAAVRSAARDRTRTDDWLMTDPQIPKSIWWYSDCNDVGFRVVCEYDDKDGLDG